MTTQLDSSVGFKKESAFGTGVTVDRFLEYTEESIDFAREFYQGSGLRAGSRMPRSARRVLVKDGVAGDISLEVPTRGIGSFLELLLGVSTATLVPSTTMYQQVFTPIKNDFLPTATFQKGVPRLGANTVDAYTARGMVCSNFEFSASNSEVLKLKTSWVGKELATDVAYAPPSYPANLELFSFVGASLTVGGTVTLPTTTTLAAGGTSVANVRDFTASFDNGLDANGYNLGGAGKLTRPPAVGAAVGKGKLTAEYDGLAFVAAVRDQTDLAIVATFQGPTAIAGQYPTLQVVIPNIRFEGELPKSNGGDVITQSLEFSILDNLTAAAPFYLVMRTADTAL